MLSVQSESLRGPSASKSGDSETSFLFFSGELTVSLVTVHLAAFRFFFFLISILEEVVMADEGAVIVPGVGPLPFEALTNLPPCLGWIGIVAGLKKKLDGSTLVGLADVGRPHAKLLHIR